MYGNIKYVTDWRKCEIKDPKDGHRIRGCGDVTVRHITNYGHPARKTDVTRLAACRVHNQSSNDNNNNKTQLDFLERKKTF